MRYFTDSILLFLYSTLTFFYVPADQSLVFALLFAGSFAALLICAGHVEHPVHIILCPC